MSSAFFVAMHLRGPRSKAWAHAPAIASKYVLICLCAHSAPSSHCMNSRRHCRCRQSSQPGGRRDAVGNVAYRWTRNHSDSSPSLRETLLTPVIALCRTVATDVSCHVEAGIGIRVLSHTRIDEPELSTAFHFGELAGSA